MPTGPRTRVEAPQAAAPRFGLLASIPTTRDQGDRWTTGIAYAPEGCAEGERFDPCDFDNNTISDMGMPAVVEWDPYVLSINEMCSTFSMMPEDMAARAERLLNMDTERQLGSELWDGALSQSAGFANTWLADDSDSAFVALDNTGVEYTHALACLEQYLADNNGGQQGVIHATVQTVAHWESFRLLRREGNNILTFKDTLVIPSPGYSGNSPDGFVSAGNVWAYATDMPRIFLGDVQIFTQGIQTTDRSQNNVQVIAQRFALVEWQRCRHAGIQIDITPCGSY